LPSFAQFEREVTGERIRDKIAASKRKGMWMGGVVPLGYALNDRHLVIDPSEAKRVKRIFDLYLELGCVMKLRQAPGTGGSSEQATDQWAGEKLGRRGLLSGSALQLASEPDLSRRDNP